MPNSNFQDVVQFHKKFDITYSGPARPLPAELKWRVDFLKEELREYEQALETMDLAGQFDALIDLVYVALGTAYLQGFPWERGWFEVHYKNMAKIRAKDGEGRGTGDIVKPEGWTPPDIGRILRIYEDMRLKGSFVRGEAGRDTEAKAE